MGAWENMVRESREREHAINLRKAREAAERTARAASRTAMAAEQQARNQRLSSSYSSGGTNGCLGPVAWAIIILAVLLVAIYLIH